MNQKTYRFLHYMWMLLCLIAVLRVDAAIEPDIVKWKAILASSANTNLFDVIGTSIPSWPSVHSPEYINKLSRTERKEQADYIEISHRIIHDAKFVIEQIPNRARSENWLRLAAILRLRDSVLVNHGYENHVLADALSRAGFLFLCKELGREHGVSPEFESLLSRLPYEIAIVVWINLATEELGLPREKFKAIEANQSLEARLHALWDLLSRGDNFAFPRNFRNMWTDNLVKQRDLSMLFYRYIYTDFMLKELKLATLYKKETSNFSLSDGKEKIDKIIPPPPSDRVSVMVSGGSPRVIMGGNATSDDKAKLSLGERFLGGQISSIQVADLIQMIKSGDIDKLLAFYRMDVLPVKTSSNTSEPNSGLKRQAPNR